MLEKLTTSKTNGTITALLSGSLLLVIAFIGVVNSGQLAEFSISARSEAEALRGISRSMEIESARWMGYAADALNLHGSTAWVTASPAMKPVQVEAQRWTAGASRVINLYGSTAVVRSGLSSAQQVEAARLSGVAANNINPYGSTAWVHAGDAPASFVEAQRLSAYAGQFFNLYGTTLQQ